MVRSSSAGLFARRIGVVSTVVLLAACGAPKSDSSSSTSSSAAGSGTSAAASCDKASLKTKTAGKLTIGTDNPAYEPWFSDNAPSNGKGYESAVAYAIAQELGYTKAEVVWAKVPFNNVITPGPKAFDLDLNQVSISEDRRKAVDFSSGYYDVTQVVITYKGSPLDGKTTVADLKNAKLGAQVGTTSYTALKDQIKPSKDPSVFDTNDLAVQALKSHQVDGIVVDLPTAFYMTAAQMDDKGAIVGQLPAADKPEQFGAVLPKGSALTECVTKAVDALRSKGTLTQLADEWLSKQGAPKLS
ncbi:ABC transporter substrate-binding protein [Yimella radicis]